MPNETMTKEEALQIAYDTLSEIIDNKPTPCFFEEEEYYKNLKKAAKKIKQMMKSR